MKIQVILEYLETPGETIYAVTGRSGTIYGYATSRADRQGRHCLIMTHEEFKAAAPDLFSCQRRYFYPIPVFEIIDEGDGKVSQTSAADSIVAESVVVEDAHTPEVDSATTVTEVSPLVAQPDASQEPPAANVKDAPAPYETQSRAELVALAESRDITVHSNTKTETIIRKLREADNVNMGGKPVIDGDSSASE